MDKLVRGLGDRPIDLEGRVGPLEHLDRRVHVVDDADHLDPDGVGGIRAAEALADGALPGQRVRAMVSLMIPTFFELMRSAPVKSRPAST